MRQKFLAVALALLATVGFTAYAQETTSGSIQGTVVDAQGAAVPGATVTITSNQGSKTFVTDNGGRFFAPFLVPGKYGVRVELTGFSPVEQKNIDVRLGARLDMSFTLKVGDLQEVIEVVGTAPTVDTSSTTTGGVLDAETLKRLPIGRNFTEALYMVPGVSDSSGVGRSNPSIAGASGLDNNYVVDGVNISNTGFGGVGTYSIVFGSLGTGVTQDFVKETQVKTGGFEAEFGQSTGGVVNVVTQSGSNSFHGAAYGYFSPYSLRSDFKQLDTPNGTVNTTDDQTIDFGISLGGPVIKDKLFFFGAFNPQYQDRKFIAPVGFPLRSLGAVERKRKVYSYAGKLSWQATSNHRFDASFFGDPSKGDMGPQRFTALLGDDTSRYSELESYGGHQQSVRYDGILNPNWLLEASFGRSTNSINEVPSVDEWQFSDLTVTPNTRSGGIGFYDKGGVGKNLQYQIKSTNIVEAAGNHQIRYGFAFEDISFARDNGRTGPPVTLSNGTVTRTGVSGLTRRADPTLPGGVYYRASRANFGPVPETTAKYYNLFLQDTWQIGKKLTFRPGVRWESQKLVGGGTPLCSSATGEPEDFTVANPGDAQCQREFKNNWSPRFGATYDIRGDGKSKIYASYGRFLSKIPNDLAARALSADAGISRADWYDAALTRPIPQGVLAGGVTNHLIIAGSGAATFNPDAQPTYQEEWVGGAEFEVASSLSVGIRYVHRSIPRVLEDVGTLSLTGYDVLGANAPEVSYFITNINTEVPSQCVPGYPCGFEDPAHKYDAVELTINKAFSNNWSMIASYRYAKLKGNFEGFFRSDNGQSDPSITSLFDFPTNDPSYTALGTPLFGYRGDIRYLGSSLGDGALPNDRPHQLKVYASYAWGSLNLGLGLNAGSGKPLTALAANPNYTNSGEIPETLRGGGIATASNVPDCSECGGFRENTPFETILDFHADYTFKFGQQRFVLMADVFNLFNSQNPTNYDTATESSFGELNANYGYPSNGAGAASTSYQAPRSIRLGARFEW